MTGSLKPDEPREKKFYLLYILFCVGIIIVLGAIGYVALEKNAPINLKNV